MTTNLNSVIETLDELSHELITPSVLSKIISSIEYLESLELINNKYEEISRCLNNILDHNSIEGDYERGSKWFEKMDLLELQAYEALSLKTGDKT